MIPFSRYLHYLLVVTGLFGTLGCQRFHPTRPTLRAIYVNGAPLPSGKYEDAWKAVPEVAVTVQRGAGHTTQRRTVRLQAVHDGRAIAILARWSDSSESADTRLWLWENQLNDYRLVENPPDQFAFLWPLTPGAANGCMLDARAASYDVWLWHSGWSAVSGYAKDEKLTVKPRPAGYSPAKAYGPLYPARDGKGLVELDWSTDAGIPGARETTKPRDFVNEQMPGYVAQEAQGSASDIKAKGVHYGKFISKDAAKKHWYHNQKGDFWFVEFYRLLTTSDAQNDYQIRGQGPHPFQIAVWDNATGGDHYISGPLRLTLEATPGGVD